MRLVDVNVLVYALREDAPRHGEFRDWLDRLVNGDGAYAMSDLVLSGFLRVATHRSVFNPPTPLETALTFAGQVRSQPGCVMVSPGPRHWDIFTRLCRDAEARGNLIPDAFLAALAIEHGCELVTTDRDFARFEGLSWSHPLQPA